MYLMSHLCNEFIDNIIRELPFCLAYLDDILVFSDDASNDEVHLE